VADQEAWKIPPSISNWKNAKGYCIPLDKRLAADGRGLQEVQRLGIGLTRAMLVQADVVWSTSSHRKRDFAPVPSVL
jgi:hypothetical protein